MPELLAFDKEKSIILNLPANGTAGLERFNDNKSRRDPLPPAKISAKVSIIFSPLQF